MASTDGVTMGVARGVVSSGQAMAGFGWFRGGAARWVLGRGLVRGLVLALVLGVVGGPLLVLSPSQVSLADAGDPVAVPIVMRQPVGGVYSVGAAARVAVQADSVDGGFLTYQWYRSVLFASPLVPPQGGGHCLKPKERL